MTKRMWHQRPPRATAPAMLQMILVMVGGAIGSGFRYNLSKVALQHMGPGFPWGTWIANLLGGLLMGVLAGTLARTVDGGEPLRLFLGVGVLGGFTTFSAFSLETYNMLVRGDYMMACAYAVSSVTGAVLMVVLGVMLTRALA